MKYLSILLLFLILSCNQKEAIQKNILTEQHLKPKDNQANNLTKVDTLQLILDEDSIQNDFVYINYIEKIITKDSLKVWKLKVDFYRDNNFENSFPLTLNSEEDVSEWYFDYGLRHHEQEANTNLFLTLSNGYPACGYTHTHYLFFTKKGSFQLIDTYFSIGDSGWYTNNVFSEFKNQTFSSRTENYWPDDDSDNEDMGVLSFSDSIVYTFENNSWKKTLITPKDTIYKAEKKLFNEIHSSSE